MHPAAPVGWALPTNMSRVGQPSRPTSGRVRRPTYRGFTLLEVVLVLAIIIAIVSIAVPLLRAPMAREKVRKTADLIMAEWTTLRVAAMRSGDHRVFRFEPGTGMYEMVFGEESDLKELPEGMIFVGSLKADDARESVEEEGLGFQSAEEPEIWFYPDGTSSDVEQLVLRNEYGMQIALALRGLTGIAVVDDNMPDVEVGMLGLGEAAEGALGVTP